MEKEGNTRNRYSLLWQPFLGVELKATRSQKAHLASGDNAQSLAHRTGGDLQDTAAERLANLSKDSGAVSDRTVSDDTHYSAHRCEGDPQDTTAGRPAIPSEDGGTVLDGITPGDTQSPAHPFSVETAALYQTPRARR